MLWTFENQKVFTLIIFGFFVHALILKAAFDIYFSSPIDHGMTPIKSTSNPPAKRLVFIVADGLRADAILGNQSLNAPHLTNIRQTRGSWGVAHTRVPTESRPGHVALLGGIYEDPAAILQGWKVNPVDFDSVINQSTNAWCWGGPSIVNMFNRDNLPHIHLHSYDASKEDFGKNDTISLDFWVYNEVEHFLKQQKNYENCKEFRQSGNLFFLHLLGIDTAGHAYKPESLEYTENIKFVDKHIPKIENLFENAFPDKLTSYIFTADHGMTNWGSHGAGSDHETKTPLIAWGAGIKINETQKDVQQIDIAPLIASLIGINIPINSLGKLPYDYIDASIENLNKMMIANVHQLMEIFNVKRFRRMNNAIRFVPFKGITTEDLQRRLNFLENLTQSDQHELFRLECEYLMKILIEGADYYHNYYQLPILISLAIGIIAWIIYLATFNIQIEKSEDSTKVTKLIQIVLFVPLYLNAVFLLKIQSLPLMYYFYFLFPIFMVQILVRRYLYIIKSLKLIKKYGFEEAIVSGLVYLFGLGLLVQGFRHRRTFCFVMNLMAGYVLFSKNLKTNTSRSDKISWILCCVIISIFPFLPVMKTSFNLVIYIIGFVLWWMYIRIVINEQLESRFNHFQLKILKLQQFIFKLTPLYTLSVEFNVITSDSFIKYIAWIWAFYPIIVIPYSTTHIIVRITSIFIGFAPFYLMVTSNYEVLFLGIYVFLLYNWLTIESKCFGYQTIYRAKYSDMAVPDKNQTNDDIRRAFFFIILIFIGFFGTGNIASLNSFDPMWVRCFLTVFSPFKMAGLILLRIMIPFIYTSCVYRGINIFRKGDILNMFCIVLMFSDLMLLQLLFCITNIGSWLEIGMSLSQFIIMEAFVIILLLLYGFAYVLTSVSYSRFN